MLLDCLGEGLFKYTKTDEILLLRYSTVCGGDSRSLPGAYASRIHGSCWDFRQVIFRRTRQSSKVSFGVFMQMSLFPSLKVGCRQLLSESGKPWSTEELNRRPGTCEHERWRKCSPGSEVRLCLLQTITSSQTGVLVAKELSNNLTYMMVQEISQDGAVLGFTKRNLDSYRTGRTEKGKWWKSNISRLLCQRIVLTQLDNSHRWNLIYEKKSSAG